MKLLKQRVSGPITVKVHWDGEMEEYRVRVYREGEAYTPADYFTQDREDAEGTSQMMLEQELKIWQNNFGPIALKATKCPCGHAGCRDWHIDALGKFMQGSGFDEGTADLIINAMVQTYPRLYKRAE